MDDDDGDSFAMGDGDNHFYANHTDLVLTSENSIKLISESPMAVHGYMSGLDTIVFDGDVGAATFANGNASISASGGGHFADKVGIGTATPAAQLHVVGGDVKVENGKFVGNGGGLLISPQGDLSMGSYTSGQQP